MCVEEPEAISASPSVKGPAVLAQYNDTGLALRRSSAPREGEAGRRGSDLHQQGTDPSGRLLYAATSPAAPCGNGILSDAKPPNTTGRTVLPWTQCEPHRRSALAMSLRPP